MKKIIAWLVLSSKDPQRISLMLKGIFTAAVTYIVFFAGIFHINVGQSDIAILSDAVVKIVETALTFISAIVTIVGLFRKIHTTVTGTNQVINQDASI